MKTGNGSLTLISPNNTHSGGTLVQEGELIVSGTEQTLGQGLATVTNGAEIRLYYVTNPTWPGWDVEVLSNATVRLQSSSSSDSLTNNLVVRNGGNIMGHATVGNYASYDKIRIEGRVFLHRYTGATGYNLWYGVFRDGAIPGTLVYTGTGGSRTEIQGAQLYTGGTEIMDGGPSAAPLKLVGSGRMPDVGAILIHNGAIMDFNNISDTVGGLAGEGRVLLGSGTVTVNEGLAPGTNDTVTGILSVTGTTGRLVLADESTSTFHLRSPGDQDQVVFKGAAGLTLTGTLAIAEFPVPKTGSYTLFDLDSGTLRGTIPALILPPYCSGTLSTNSGDVVLSLKVPENGTLMMIN